MSEPNKETAAENPPATSPTATAAPATATPRRRGKPTGWRKWLYRLASMTLVPALLFGVLELALRLGGYGYPTDFFLAGSRTERAGLLIDNPGFGRWVFPYDLDRRPQPLPFVFPAVKTAGTYRVFVLGESAAMGFPDPSSSFARALETMLRARYPDTRFEVINASMVAINSHVVRQIALQCLRRQPDLLVVHLGNNEVVGPFGAAGVLGPFSPSLGVIRTNLWVKTTRFGQLLNALIQSFKSDGQRPRAWDGMAMFQGSHVAADDSRLPRIHGHLRDNLQDICSAGTAAGVPVIVCTIPVNLKDCAPFGSQHAAGLGTERTEAWDTAYGDGARLEGAKKFTEALRRFEEAAQVDDRFADLAFRRARCHAALGQTADAKKHYARARDLDTLRFRSDTKINETIRSVAAARAADGVYLADAERAFEEAAPAGIPGEEFFLEHVHMNFKGNYLVARTVFKAIADIAPAALGARAEKNVAPLSEGECGARLAHTEWNAFKIETQIEGMMVMPPFNGQLDRAERKQRWKAKLDGMRQRLGPEGLEKAIAEYRKAVAAADEDWMLRMNFGQLLTEYGDVEGAEAQYLTVLEQFRHCFAAHYKLGLVLVRAGRVPEAVAHYRQALRLNPGYPEVNFALAEALAVQGKTDAAVALYEAQSLKESKRAPALVALGGFLTRVGRFKEARVRLTEALELEPENVRAHTHLGDTALKEGHRDEAIRHYETALRLQPEWPDMRGYLAKLKSEGGRAPNAPK